MAKSFSANRQWLANAHHYLRTPALRATHYLGIHRQRPKPAALKNTAIRDTSIADRAAAPILIQDAGAGGGSDLGMLPTPLLLTIE
jgi:hypothetical protein